MNERRRIEDRIQKKAEEIEALEAQIRDARSYIQALQDVLKMLPRGAASPRPSARTLRQGSATWKVREFILRKKGPAHISELLEALGREMTRGARASLSGSLAAYVRKGEVFTRPNPNTFGLIELGHENKERGSVLDDEPPSDFGQDRSASAHAREDVSLQSDHSKT